MFLQKRLLGIWAGSTLTLALSLGFAGQAQALTLYVDARNGSYRDPTSYTKAANRVIASDPSTPVRTITNAAQLADPYDVIEVAPTGIYTEANISYKSYLDIHGKPNAPKPIIKPGPENNFAAVKIDGSDHITFQGFEIDGSTGGPDMSGVTIATRTTGNVVTPSLNIKVAYNLIHDAGQAGIASIANISGTIQPDTRTSGVYGCDYITISGNEIYGCLKTGKDGGSAISLLMLKDYDGTAGYHNIVQTNRIHDNVINPTNPYIQTDGNGIIIDLGNPTCPKTLVQNNLVYRNGGRGIHIFNSSNVDVFNNTCYKNCNAPGLFSDARLTAGVGEITAVSYVGDNNEIWAKNINVYNNLCVANNGIPCLIGQNYGKYEKIPGTQTNDLTKWRIENIDPSVKFSYNSYNTTYNFISKTGTTPPVTGTNLFLITDPLFVSASTGNFKLANGSLAIDKGTMTKYATGTIDGLTRPVGLGVDLGAYDRAK